MASGKLPSTANRPPERGLFFFSVAAGALIAGVAYIALAYSAAFRNFFFDDELLYLAAAAEARSPLYAFTTFVQGFPRPVIHAYFYGLWHVLGPRAGGYYVAGAALFLANVGLFGLFAAKVLQSRWWGLAAAVVAATAFYPLETIYCVAAGATELTCGAFYLTALFFYVEYKRKGGGWRLAALITATALAYGAKESALSLVPALAACELLLAPSGRPGRWRPFVPLLALTVAYVAADVYVQLAGAADAPSRLKYYPGGHAFVNLVAGALYVLTAALPPRVGEFVAVKTWPWAAAWVFAAALLPGRRAVLFALIWLTLALAPFVFWKVLVIYGMPRYLFLPSLASALGVVAASRGVTSFIKNKRLAAAVAVAALAAFAAFNGAYIPTRAAKYTRAGDQVREGVTRFRAGDDNGLAAIPPWYRPAVRTVFINAG